MTKKTEFCCLSLSAIYNESLYMINYLNNRYLYIYLLSFSVLYLEKTIMYKTKLSFMRYFQSSFDRKNFENKN